MRPITLNVPDELADRWETLPEEKRHRFAVAAAPTLAAIMETTDDEDDEDYPPLTPEEIVERDRKLAALRAFIGKPRQGEPTHGPIPRAELRREAIHREGHDY